MFSSRMMYMSVSFAMAALTSFIIPLGRFLLYKISTVLGFGEVGEISGTDLRKKTDISFTDAKILETKCWKLIHQEDFDEVIFTGRRVLGSLDKKNFPSLWKAMIFAFIQKEDFFEAQKWAGDYEKCFINSSLLESGQLFNAYIKAFQGDFATSLKIIRSMSDVRIKSFSNDETAICLLTLGRCDLAYKEHVQAHIDLTKAFDCAKLPFLKAEALLELIELDFRMNSDEAVKKWTEKANEIKGGPKTQSLIYSVHSIGAFAAGDSVKAIQLAESSTRDNIKNSRATYWHGHLLCKLNKVSEAEVLLGLMTAGTYDSNRLMEEVTGTPS
jgi:tetratricopeptide (TPR) repeat protein